MRLDRQRSIKMSVRTPNSLAVPDIEMDDISIEQRGESNPADELEDGPGMPRSVSPSDGALNARPKV